MGNCFTGLCTDCTGYNNHSVTAACCSGISGVVVKRFDCAYVCVRMLRVLVFVTTCFEYMGGCLSGKPGVWSQLISVIDPTKTLAT